MGKLGITLPLDPVAKQRRPSRLFDHPAVAGENCLNGIRLAFHPLRRTLRCDHQEIRLFASRRNEQMPLPQAGQSGM